MHRYWMYVHKSTPVLYKSSRVDSERYGVKCVEILPTIYSMHRENMAIIMHLYIQYIENQYKSKILHVI